MWHQQKKKKREKALLSMFYCSSGFPTSTYSLSLIQFKLSLSLDKKHKCYSLFSHFLLQNMKFKTEFCDSQRSSDFLRASFICGQQASKGFTWKHSTREKLTITFYSHSNFHPTPVTYSSNDNIIYTFIIEDRD